MLNYQFTIIIEPDEDGFHAYVPVLRGCHSFGLTLEEAQANIAEAISLHLEGFLEDGEPIPIERGLRVTRKLSQSIIRLWLNIESFVQHSQQFFTTAPFGTFR